MSDAVDVWSWTDPAFQVAPQLLGSILRVGEVSLRITEVEAYMGSGDPASHCFRGRTRRNAAMFGAGGRIYCYLSHGIHTAVNLVCGDDGEGQGVLVRSGEIVDGLSLARSRRGEGVPDVRLARGPGCVGKALGLTVADSGRTLDDPDLDVIPGVGPVDYASGPRVGVSVAADVPWRFWIPGDPTVSAYRRSPRAPAPPEP